MFDSATIAPPPPVNSWLPVHAAGRAEAAWWVGAALPWSTTDEDVADIAASARVPGGGPPPEPTPDGELWLASPISPAILDPERYVAEGDVVEHAEDFLARPDYGPTDVQLTGAGPELAAVLQMIDRDALDDEGLVELVAAWQRLASWVFLGASRAAASLADRASMNPSWPFQAARTDLSCTAGDEIAMRLAWSRRAGAQMVRNGRALNGPMLATADALAAGEIDTPKALVLIDRLWNAAPDLADAVQGEVLPGAELRTPRQLASDVERAILAISPADAAARHRAARADRRVDRPRRLPDGMAGMWAVLPAESAVEIDTLLEATARTARAAADPRTLDQLRADTLVDILTGRAGCTHPVDFARGAVATRAGEAPVPGAGPSGARDDAQGREPRPPAWPGPVETTPFDGSTGACSADESLVDHRPAARVRRPRIQVNVTVALSTLLGLDENPAELDGYGPLQAAQARALARGGVWRRLVTDPTSGAVLDVGRTRYRPPADLADHVRQRDRTCVRPHCSASAEQCDLDHTIEFHDSAGTGGTTSAGNLGPLCRRDHRLKTDGGHRLTQPSPGRFEWVTPAGVRYLVVPGTDGTVERTGGRRRRRAVVLPVPAPDPGPPPF